MIIRRLIAYCVLLLTLYSCGNNHGNKSKKDNKYYFPENREPIQKKYFGVSMDKDQIFGCVYKNPSGQQYAFRCHRAIFTNDSLIPVHLRLSFPDDYTNMTSSDEKKFKVFFIPDSLTNEEFPNSSFIGWPGKSLEAFLNSNARKQIVLDKIIMPNEKFEFRIGLLFFPVDGVTRVELFSKGHGHHLRLPELATDNSVQNKLNIMLGATVDQDFAILSCGQLSYSD